MAITQEEWQANEREIINEFFNVKVPQLYERENQEMLVCNENLCTQFGKQIVNADDLVPVENQGANSFTLVSRSKSKIVQFRLRPFDTDTVKLAHEIYHSQVPSTISHSGFVLPVYSSDIIPGQVHVLQPFPSGSFPLQRQRTTITQLGSFIAKAAFYPQPRFSYKSWTFQSKSTLQRLGLNESLQTLAPDLVHIVTHLESRIHLLDQLPPVLTHHDFSEVNILVDEYGNVTGVIDFDFADIEAFGMCIWGIYECFLGSMEQGKWSFYSQPAEGYPGKSVKDVLEAAFWESLWSCVPQQLKRRREELEPALKVSLSIGILNRYFIRGMLDNIDESKKVHRLSLEYAKGILPAVCPL